MRKNILVLVGIFVFFQSTFAQTPTAKLYPKLQYEGFLDVSPQAFLYVDSSSSKSIQNIDNQAFTPLKNTPFKKFDARNYKNTYWLKFSVENPDTIALDLLFTASHHHIVTLYRKTEKGYEVTGETQQKFLPDERLYRYDEQYIPVKLSPKTTYQFVVKIVEHPQLNFMLQPKFVSRNWDYADKVRAFFDEYFTLLSDGFFVSVLFFVSIFAVILYFLDRNLYYIYYAIYVLLIFLFSLWGIEHSPYFHIFFGYFTFLKFSGDNNTYVLLSHIFYYLFLSEFLELKTVAPKFQRFIRTQNIITLAVFFVDSYIRYVLRNYEIAAYIWMATQIILPIVDIVMQVKLFQLKGKLARYIQIGSFILSLGVIAGFAEQLFVLKPTNVVIMRYTPSYAFNLAAMIETFFFATAIGFKTWLAQREKSQLIRAMKESELRTLRSQINPHFVFNSLNSIKSYILTHRSVEAAEYLTDFSTLMRSILQYSKEQLILLKDELETAVLYVQLEKHRFEEGFEFIYELDPEIDTDNVLIPPLLLQPYLENAIKHGLMNSEEKRVLSLTIKHLEDSILITIDDNGIGREAASLLRKNTTRHQSMGMNINEERVKLLSITNDLHISVEIIDKKRSNGKPAGTKVVINLPI